MVLYFHKPLKERDDLMIKKLIAMIISIFVVFAVFVGCAENNMVSSDVSSAGASSEISADECNKVSSKIETSSVSSKESDFSSDKTSSNKTVIIKLPSKPSKNETSSVSSSGEVKRYTNPGNVGMMSYSLNMSTTTALGKDAASREKYFRAIVEEGYFNQYLVNCNNELLTHAEIVAEAGGSIWIIAGTSVKNLPSYINNVKTQFEKLKEAELLDVVNGFFWDEPTLGNRTSLEDFHTITKTLYQTFGLRNFPVFGTAEFTGNEGNTSVNPGTKKQTILTTKSLEYVTDMGFDSYSIDVRDGASNGGSSQFAKWQASCSKDIVDGKSFYTEHRKLLQKIANKPVNYWHWPSAWYDYLWGGLNGLKYADEAFWTAHLNFMANDVLEQENPGGLCIYTFRRVDTDTNVAFERRMDLKNDSNDFMVYPDVDKYYIYSERLRFWKEVFDSKKPNIIR